MATAGQKRPREDDDEEDRPAKIPRMTGVVAGDNWWTYPQFSRTPKSNLPLFDSNEEKMESPAQKHRFWQNFQAETPMDSLDSSITLAQQRKWLDSNPQWQNGLNGSWKGKRVLGKGGFGLVGLWECTRPNGEVKRVVVKQSKRQDTSLKRESGLLNQLTSTGTRHVVRLLKRYHEEVGIGTSSWDSDHHFISRIYLEFCEQGDMKGMIKQITRHYDQLKTHVPEEYIWFIWECLARGLCVMQNGNENLDGPRWDESEIIHFDIKPHNILIGKKDSEHTMMGVYKFADLGLSLPAPPILDSEAWIKRTSRRGTPGWFAPEQTDRRTPNRTIGTPANVWMVARCMYLLVRLGRIFNSDNYFECYLVDTDMHIQTYGRKILRPEFDHYSDTLRILLLRCLARDPTHRPTPRELLGICQTALKKFMPTITPFPGIPPGPAGNERGEGEAVNSAWFSSSGYTQPSVVAEEDLNPESINYSNQQPKAPLNFPDEWMESLGRDGV